MVPRCPFCNAQGVNQIEAKAIGPALLLFCKSCGAIHGVIPAPTPKPEPKFEVKPLEEIEQSPTPKPPPKPKAPERPLTPQQAALLQRQGVQKATAYRIYLTGDHDREDKT